MYSNAYPSNGGNLNSFQQVIEWHNFMGSDIFCLKACDPARPNAARFCEHVFDRIGCAYNAPNAARNGTFTSCDGENQDFPGIYTTGGQVVTYTQPPESLGAISTIPYTARIPSSSNCVTYTSSSIYAALPTTSGARPPATTVSRSATRSGSTASATSTSGTRSLVVSYSLAGIVHAILVGILFM